MKHLTLLTIALYSVVAVHLALVFAMSVSIPLLFINQPWYVALPLSIWIMHLSKGPFRCPLTQLENKIRVDLGKPKISGFISHYFSWRH